MKRKKLEQTVSRYIDGELSRGAADRVRESLQHDDELQAAEKEWDTIRTLLCSQPIPPIQTSEAAWADIQRELRRAEGDGREGWPVFDSRFKWATGMMTTILLAGVVWFVSNWEARNPKVAALENQGDANTVDAIGGAVEVEWVEAELPGSTSIVFQDEDTGVTVIWLVEANDQESGSS